MTPSLLPPRLNRPHIEVLPNGLTIIAEQMPVEAVSFQLWLRVGSRWEGDDINGTAHFLEHMVFKGTPRLAMGEFERAIESRGAGTNAATSQDYTQFYFTSAPQDFEHLAPLQLDVVLNPTIADGPFERERLVVLEEIRRSQDDPQRRIFQQVVQLAFPHTPYARPVLGAREIITHLQAQQMRDFHAHWYQPQAITATVVGNRPVAHLVETVASSFADCYRVKSPSQALTPPPVNIPPPFTAVETTTVVDKGLQQARLILLWRSPGLDQFEQTLPLGVLAVILGRGRVSRLFRELREEKGLVTAIGASNSTQATQGMFYISAQLPAENIAIVERCILDHIERLQNELVPEKDLERIRTQVANRFVFGNERPGDRANLYGYYYAQIGDLEPALTYPEQIQALTAEDLQRSAQTYLSPTAYGKVVALPEPL
ncbi:insulinase family protein [Synechocystis salina LEGE 06099]|uniref:M16 family metallopeptidase n=1 Tax=Synechocystis salina TaxID=945780 RepID=UPI00187FFC24|nr:pitrilysin family protein [Synechocystis salina]MBE9204695.1 insulinase family protein [Synechocystis salina LEGE 06099]